MLDKTRKIIYIITGTLTIISLVFMLMHKVGLCAQVTPSSYVTQFPLPFGAGSNFGYGDFPLSSSLIEVAVNAALTGSDSSYYTNGYVVLVREVPQDLSYITLRVSGVDPSTSFITGFTGTYPNFDSNTKITFKVFRYHDYKVFSDGTFTALGRGITSSTVTLNISNSLSVLPDTSYYFPSGTVITNYPVLFSSDDLRTYDNNLFFGSSSSGHPLGGGSGEITTLPNMEDLTGSPSSGDTNDTLFSILKGWLSTINGNIKKGFTNIYDNISSFLQPYLERFKAVTDIIENPEDFLFCSQERQQELLQGSQVYQDVQSLQGIGQNVFGVLGANASDHVYWTFDFSDTVLDSCGVVQIDFDWYDSIRNYVVPLFMAFFYVGMLLLIIRKIPGIISGASSNSDDK